METSIPTCPEDITPEWLSRVLIASGTLIQSQVTAVEIQSLGEEQGYAGKIVRCKLTYDVPEATAPRSIIGKFAHPDPDIRRLHNYKTEVCFYQKLSDRIGVRAPNCYFGAFNDATGDAVLLLEDLRQGRIGDTVGSCSSQEAVMAIRHLATFHAAWWETPQLEELTWIPISPLVSIDDPAIMQEWRQTRDDSWDRLKSRHPDLIPSSLEEIWQLLGQYGREIRRQLLALPLTLCHGDYRLDNLFFDASDVDAPLAIFDWQYLTRGHGLAMLDLALFLMTSLEPEERRNIEADLLQQYCVALNENGVVVTFEQCLHSYRVGLYEMVAPLLHWGGSMDYSSDRDKVWISTLVRRLSAAVADHPLDEITR